MQHCISQPIFYIAFSFCIRGHTELGDLALVWDPSGVGDLAVACVGLGGDRRKDPGGTVGHLHALSTFSRRDRSWEVIDPTTAWLALLTLNHSTIASRVLWPAEVDALRHRTSVMCSWALPSPSLIAVIWIILCLLVAAERRSVSRPVSQPQERSRNRCYGNRCYV
jgi:hypothetical protein